MYKLLLRVPGAVDDLKKAFNGYLKRKGTEMVEDTNRDKEMIDDLLGFKAKTDGLLESAFERNDQFSYAVKDAFEYILNVRQVCIPLLSKTEPIIIHTHTVFRVSFLSSPGLSFIATFRYLPLTRFPLFLFPPNRAVQQNCWPSSWTPSSRARRARGTTTWKSCSTRSWCSSATSGPRTCSRPSTRRTSPSACCSVRCHCLNFRGVSVLKLGGYF